MTSGFKVVAPEWFFAQRTNGRCFKFQAIFWIDRQPVLPPLSSLLRDKIGSGGCHIWDVQNATVSNSLLWARCIKLSLWKFYANDNCNLMKCRKVWSNKAYFEYERNWEKLTWNIKQSYSGLFPIWIGLHQRWIPQCNAWAGGYSRYFAATGEFLSFLQRCWSG